MRFLAAQHVERDGVEHRFFGGCFGIFGHGNVAGIGEALYESPELLTYYQARSEQGDGAHGGRVRADAEPARGARLHDVDRAGRDEHGHRRRRSRPSTGCRCCCSPATSSPRGGPTRCCSSSRIPSAGDVSVNDCFRPVSRYFDRIWRPEQVVPAALQAMRVLVNQAETGAVTLAFPQDVQTEAFDFPDGFLSKRVWHVPRAAAGRGRRFAQAAAADPRRANAR